MARIEVVESLLMEPWFLPLLVRNFDDVRVLTAVYRGGMTVVPIIVKSEEVPDNDDYIICPSMMRMPGVDPFIVDMGEDD